MADWGCEDLYDREAEPRDAWVAPELPGVLGTVPVATRVLRAVSGVGALIKDFFGVSNKCLLLLLLVKLDVVDCSNDRAVLLGVAGAGLGRLPAVIKGCRRAAWGLIRRSGSQTRHLEMKSRKSSSSVRKTWASDLVPGRLRRPFELTTGLGAPVVSKNNSQYMLISYHRNWNIPKKSRFR